MIAWQSIRLRITSFSLLIFAAFLLVLSALLFRMFSERQQLAFDSALFNQAVDISNATDISMLGQLFVHRDAIPEDKVFPFALGLSLIQFRSIDGKVMLASSTLKRQELPFSADIVAEASHQLKTPLAIIRGELEVFRSKERTGPELSEFLKSLDEEVGTLSKTVSQLLLLARFDSEREKPAFSPQRLDEVILETISSLKRVGASAGVDVSFTISPRAEAAASFEVMGDSDLLRLLLYNLVENAIKYTSRGTSVKVSLDALDTELIVSVTDEGPGVSSADAEKIFERFHRASSSSSASGVGLGLAIARKIASLHGAEIALENPGQAGAKFILRIKKI